ncbi:MAG: peptidase T, partial [Proteobacteria bacterium]|nr:peptidase T [Pseudomonadota bacterium]
VEPLVHRAYDGRPVALPGDPSQVLDPDRPGFADLRDAVGKDLVTASGTTLLGADDKAGVAVLMTLAERLLGGPSAPRGPIRLCFTPDEEVGRGVDGLDLGELNAHVAYTLDGGAPGELNWETFSADQAVVTIRGVATHPGQARRYGMVNAVHLAGKLLSALPREAASPEATDGRQGFVHPVGIEGDAARCTVRLLLRDHDEENLASWRRMLRAQCRALQAGYPGARITCRMARQYRNMGLWLRERMLPVELARAAYRACGLEPVETPIRGGTDGSRLTERGLPCPNLFCGARNPHGPLEWVAAQDMEKAVDVLVALVRLWEERGAGSFGGP